MKIKGVEFLIGADPEFAVMDLKRELFVPACGLVPGDKLNPYALPIGDVQVDGTSVEIGIPPAKTKKQFVSSILKTKALVQQMLPPDHILVCTPHVQYTPEILAECPPEAFISGCTPDYWLGDVQNPSTWGTTPPKTPEGFGHAYFGGHIHIGWTSGKHEKDPAHIIDCQVLVNYLSRCLPHGLNSGRVSSGYGTPTSYRIKPYGVEFRAPSNWWCHNEETISLMYDMIKECLTSFMGKVQVGKLDFNVELISRQAIMTHARGIYNREISLGWRTEVFSHLLSLPNWGITSKASILEYLRKEYSKTLRGKKRSGLSVPSSHEVHEVQSNSSPLQETYELGA